MLLFTVARSNCKLLAEPFSTQHKPLTNQIIYKATTSRSMRLTVSALWLLRIAEEVNSFKGDNMFVGVDGPSNSITVIEMDCAHVCLLEAVLKPPFAHVAEVPTKGTTKQGFSISTSMLVDALQREFFDAINESTGRVKASALKGRESEMVDIHVAEEDGTIHFSANGDAIFSLPLMSERHDPLCIPSMNHSSVCTMDTSKVSRTIKAISTLGSQTVIMKTPTATARGRAMFHLDCDADGVLSQMQIPVVKRNHEDLVEKMSDMSVAGEEVIDEEHFVVQHYATRYLQLFLNFGVKNSFDAVTFLHTLNTPLRVQYHVDAASSVSFFLAPKIVD